MFQLSISLNSFAANCALLKPPSLLSSAVFVKEWSWKQQHVQGAC